MELPYSSKTERNSSQTDYPQADVASRDGSDTRYRAAASHRGVPDHCREQLWRVGVDRRVRATDGSFGDHHLYDRHRWRR